MSIKGHSSSPSHRYFVTVVTGNHVSNATSSPLQLIIEASISRLEIHVEDDASLIGTITVLAAQTYSGSDVRYIWDFGDGTPELNTHQAVVNHNYNRCGSLLFNLQNFVVKVITNGVFRWFVIIPSKYLTYY